MADIGDAREALVRRILEGDGKASREERRAAFDKRGVAAPGALVEKVATEAHRVTDEDVRAAVAAGLSEDQVFEIVVCAAVGQAMRQYDAGVAALAAASGKG